jgi:hypothetical protein
MRLGAAFEQEHVAPGARARTLSLSCGPAPPHSAPRRARWNRSPALHAVACAVRSRKPPHALTVAPASVNPVLQQKLIRVSVVLSPSTSFALPGTAFPPVCLRKTRAASCLSVAELPLPPTSLLRLSPSGYRMSRSGADVRT